MPAELLFLLLLIGGLASLIAIFLYFSGDDDVRTIKGKLFIFTINSLLCCITVWLIFAYKLQQEEIEKTVPVYNIETDHGSVGVIYFNDKLINLNGALNRQINETEVTIRVTRQQPRGGINFSDVYDDEYVLVDTGEKLEIEDDR